MGNYEQSRSFSFVRSLPAFRLTYSVYCWAHATRIDDLWRQPDQMFDSFCRHHTSRPDSSNECFGSQSAKYSTSAYLMQYSIWYRERDDVDRGEVADNSGQLFWYYLKGMIVCECAESRSSFRLPSMRTPWLIYCPKLQASIGGTLLRCAPLMTTRAFQSGVIWERVNNSSEIEQSSLFGSGLILTDRSCIGYPAAKACTFLGPPSPNWKFRISEKSRDHSFCWPVLKEFTEPNIIPSPQGCGWESSCRAAST